MGCRKQKYFIKDCWNKNNNKGAKSSKKVKITKEVRNVRECLIRSFAFCYNKIY